MTPHNTLPTTRPANSDNKQLWVGMTAALFAELEEMVPHDLVADIVRGVLHENRQHAPDRTAESSMLAARQRLERIIRARPARYSKSRPSVVR